MEAATAFFTEDTMVFGLLMLTLGVVFYIGQCKGRFWSKFNTYIPGLVLCYIIPAVLNSIGIVSAEDSNLYYVASRYLLPAALVLMTLSIDLKAIFNLGPKALILFFTGTIGIVIGGPIAIILVSIFSPETVGGAGPDAIWRGLSTLAGSWIGGGANQAAMLEIFNYNPEKYGAMVLVDVVVSNLWMAILLLGIPRSKQIDTWLKADTSSIERLKAKISKYTEATSRVTSLNDLMLILAIAFTSVGLSHWGAKNISSFLKNNVTAVSDKQNALSSFGSEFFWMITLATAIGIILSYTKAKNYEGAGASKIGSVCIYILVATIGMKIDLTKILENPGLIVIGLIWMAIHGILLFIVAKITKAPYFFLAVGSQANVGAAASAPVVAAAFHPSLASVGVLLAVFGYAVGTYGALLCTYLMEFASKM